MTVQSGAITAEISGALMPKGDRRIDFDAVRGAQPDQLIVLAKK